ncbi:chromate ion transporter [Xylogone sp. PMI_703]|nr:chromate ion transporter [Xylogone sp. PMI_703]
MPITALFHAWNSFDRDPSNAYQANNDKLLKRLEDVFLRTWDLGLTAFGGPPVHFRIFHRRFVDCKEKISWIDEQTFQEFFTVSQALPGPASTKMLFCIALIHSGFLPALFVFLLWSMPGAIGMYGLSLGVLRIGDTLPDIVYALLSGLNAATVGIIALAAVQLSEKAIKDNLTRILVIFGGCAGLCYNALWYFPVLMVTGGITTTVWDLYLRQASRKIKTSFRRPRNNIQPEAEETGNQESIVLNPVQPTAVIQKRTVTSRSVNNPETVMGTMPTPQNGIEDHPVQRNVGGSMDTSSHAIPIKLGVPIIVGFFLSFIVILVSRAVLHSPPLELDLFASMYLAGTVIFGGGPVVIPLLRAYVVQPGWVSSRDFLIGLAIIQAFPGPNFNFAVYLGALTLASISKPTILGALLGFIGLFFPGLALTVGFQSIWRVLRTKPITSSILRGVNATAVGLIFTAVYRLWEIGYLSSSATSGQSLSKEPFWLVISTVAYAANAWFKVPPPAAIMAGGVLGLCWYGAVGH